MICKGEFGGGEVDRWTAVKDLDQSGHKQEAGGSYLSAVLGDELVLLHRLLDEDAPAGHIGRRQQQMLRRKQREEQTDVSRSGQSVTFIGSSIHFS